MSALAASSLCQEMLESMVSKNVEVPMLLVTAKSNFLVLFTPMLLQNVRVALLAPWGALLFGICNSFLWSRNLLSYSNSRQV